VYRNVWCHIIPGAGYNNKNLHPRFASGKVKIQLHDDFVTSVFRHGYMVPRLELQQHNCSLCLTHRHMEDESTRTPAGNLPRTFADHSPWHDKASSARLAPSKLCTTDTTRNEFCTAADKLGVGMRNRDEPDNRDDQAHPEKSLRSAADAMQAWHNRSQLKMRRARQRDELDVAE